MPAGIEEDEDDEDEDDSELGEEVEEFVLCTLDPAKVCHEPQFRSR
jgi:FK506-binding nuclear protein